MDHRVKPGGDEQRVNGDDELFRRRDAPSHPSFATPRNAKPRKHSQEASSLKRREAERREAHHRAASTSDAARTLSPVFPLREDRGPRLHRALDLKKWSGRARLSTPHRGIRGLLGLGSAQAALPGITGCKREDPLRHQCSEHLAVRHAPDGTMPKPPASAVYRCSRENRSRSASRSTLAKGVPLRAGFWLGNCYGDESQGRCRFIRDRLVGRISAA
jgi:hypothetical protein